EQEHLMNELRVESTAEARANEIIQHRSRRTRGSKAKKNRPFFYKQIKWLDKWKQQVPRERLAFKAPASGKKKKKKKGTPRSAWKEASKIRVVTPRCSVQKARDQEEEHRKPAAALALIKAHA